MSPSPLRQQQQQQQRPQIGGGPPSSVPEGALGSTLSVPGGGGRPGGAAPSLSNAGLSSDALEENDRNQGARRVIWNTAVSLDETMTSFKGFLQDFKAKYRVELARKNGKPLPTTNVNTPEKLVYEH
jgi:DNA replication licensing factor MCM4